MAVSIEDQSFNRTRLELKQVYADEDKPEYYGFNRTRLELKRRWKEKNKWDELRL